MNITKNENKINFLSVEQLNQMVVEVANEILGKGENVEVFVNKIINGFKNQLEYLGLEIKVQEDYNPTKTRFFADVEKVLGYFEGSNLTNELLNDTKQVKDFLTKNPLDMINPNKDFEKTVLGKNIELIENKSKMNEYITQAEACRLLDKESGYIANMLNNFGVKVINGRKMLNKALVLEYKEILNEKEQLQSNKKFMNIKEVAKELSRSEDFIYKIINEGNLKSTGKYIEKNEVEKYKKNIEEMYLKYNSYDYFTVKETSVLMGVSKQTVNNLITNNELFNTVELVGKVYFLPREEVLKGIKNKRSNPNEIMKNRDKKMVDILNLLVEKQKVNDKDGLDKLKKECENLGMNYIYSENLKRLKRGEEIYIPTI